MSESGGDRHGAHDLVPVSAVTHTAVQSGLWQAPETWDSGVPTDSARAHVPDGTTVTVDHEDDASLDWLRVDGTLRFDPATDTQLRVETVVTTAASRFEMGTQNAPVASDHTARLVVADRGPIDTEFDPGRRSKGLITMGTVRLTGAEKTSWTALASHATAGDSSLELAEAPTGWQPGDTLVLPGQTPPDTDDSGTLREDAIEDEEVTIRAVRGTRVELDQPLSDDHVPPARAFDSYVLNLTRNVRIESENATLDRRGHVMFMDRDVELPEQRASRGDLGRGGVQDQGVGAGIDAHRFGLDQLGQCLGAGILDGQKDGLRIAGRIGGRRVRLLFRPLADRLDCFAEPIDWHVADIHAQGVIGRGPQRYGQKRDGH
jgi:hypothetical protein